MDPLHVHAAVAVFRRALEFHLDAAVAHGAVEHVEDGVAGAEDLLCRGEDHAVRRHIFSALQGGVEVVPILQNGIAPDAEGDGIGFFGDVVDMGEVIFVYRLYFRAGTEHGDHQRRKRQPGKEGKLGVEGMRPEVLEAALRRAGATFLDEEETAVPPRRAITKADLMALGLSGGPGAAERRKFLDECICQLRPRYAAALAEYHRLYDHKTRILRDSDERPDLLDLLPDFNERMVRFGAVLIHYRQQFAQALNRDAARHHRECSGGREQLEITYRTVSSVTDPAADVEVLTEQLRSHMESHQAAERASRMCLSGPHKDDLVITIDGREAKSYSSQGQTRTAALALKLAEREIYQNATGEYPVLLLDDVLSELDPRRQEFVLNRIAGGQVFITCCEDDRLPQMLGGKVFHVKQGAISG